MSKTIPINFRINKEVKASFFQNAKKLGISPSALLSTFIINFNKSKKITLSLEEPIKFEPFYTDKTEIKAQNSNPKKTFSRSAHAQTELKTLQKQYLFWDIDIKTIDPIKHKSFIIERILERGDLDDFKWIIDFYGKKLVKKIFLEKQTNLNKKSQNFLVNYF